MCVYDKQTYAQRRINAFVYIHLHLRRDRPSRYKGHNISSFVKKDCAYDYKLHARSKRKYFLSTIFWKINACLCLECPRNFEHIPVRSLLHYHTIYLNYYTILLAIMRTLLCPHFKGGVPWKIFSA